jgi:DNA-binding FadR family transcriptional regulator
MTVRRGDVAEGRDRGSAAPIPIAAGGSVLRPLKAAEIVARDLVRTIRARGLRSGDHLEGEAQMLAQYDVSRETLREGLRLLEVQGMVSIRRGPGGGPVVGTVDSANLGRMEALYFHLAGATYDELFETWVFAETELARRAAANPDDGVRRAAMARYLDGQVDQVAHDDLDVYMQGHEGFHGAVAALAGNRVMQVTFRSYGQIVAHHLATIGDIRTIHQELVDDHLGLAKAVHDGDSDASAALMQDHLTQVIELNRAQLGGLPEGDVEWI